MKKYYTRDEYISRKTRFSRWITRSWLGKLCESWFFSYTQWNGVFGPGGDQSRYVRKDRIWISFLITMLIVWMTIITILLIK